MRQPVREIRRQPLRLRRFQNGIRPQRQDLRPTDRVAARFHAPPHRVHRQTGRPRFVEPLFERSALIRPAIVIIRRRHFRANPRQLRRLPPPPPGMTCPPPTSPTPFPPRSRIGKPRPPPHPLAPLL